ncbi:hypothetical protein [Streptacidiphilus sp. MAP5-3]|uniref:hypothetical protein n=1 Tax=unclassified Streptacidiphilus TaxID=2643834 RepID=UPI003511A2AA
MDQHLLRRRLQGEARSNVVDRDVPCAPRLQADHILADGQLPCRVDVSGESPLNIVHVDPWPLPTSTTATERTP